MEARHRAAQAWAGYGIENEHGAAHLQPETAGQVRAVADSDEASWMSKLRQRTAQRIARKRGWSDRYTRNRDGSRDFRDRLQIKTELAEPSHRSHSIGKSATDGKWYGWSHRAYYGFPRKQQARRFARSVS